MPFKLMHTTAALLVDQLLRSARHRRCPGPPLLAMQSSSDDWAKGAVACAAGAMDFTTRLRANSGRSLMGDNGSPSFWSLARQCRGEFLDFVERGFVAESVRLRRGLSDMV